LFLSNITVAMIIILFSFYLWSIITLEAAFFFICETTKVFNRFFFIFVAFLANWQDFLYQFFRINYILKIIFRFFLQNLSLIINFGMKVLRLATIFLLIVFIIIVIITLALISEQVSIKVFFELFLDRISSSAILLQSQLVLFNFKLLLNFYDFIIKKGIIFILILIELIYILWWLPTWNQIWPFYFIHHIIKSNSSLWWISATFSFLWLSLSFSKFILSHRCKWPLS
jgi:hypothetical protein